MEYKVSELMISLMAREIKDGDKVLQGLYSPMPMLACLLAKNFHAPNMTYFNTADVVDPNPTEVPFSTAGPKLQENCIAYLPLAEVFDLAQKGELSLIFLGAAQVDMYGNTNLSVIGDYHNPKVRLPGGAASAYLCGFMETVIWIPKHNPKVFVEKVPFITGQGYINGWDTRERLGIGRGGPRKVITNLCVMDFEPKTKRMRLVSVHPGVTVEDVVNNTGFELIIPEEVPTTAPPTPEEIEFIRNIDPNNVREIEFK